METGRSLFLSQVGTIIPHNTPFVFWDSCAILDIIRVLERGTFENYSRYEKFVKAIEEGRLTSITSALTIVEFDDNYQETEDDMNKTLRDMINKVKKTAGIMNDGADKIKVLEAIDHIDVTEKIKDLANRLWKKTFIINDEHKIQTATHQRTIDKKAPSENKSQYKDCFIWNTYIMVAEEIRNAIVGPMPASAFVSTNTSDYGEGSKNLTPHSYLVNESKSFNGSLHLNVGSLYGYLERNGVAL